MLINPLVPCTLAVKDNGSGLSEDTLAQLFIPFFTTNRENCGTGLGMNIIKSIVTEQLAGEIELSSTEGKGFKVSMKILEETSRIEL